MPQRRVSLATSITLLKLSITLLESSVILLESSIMLLENFYSSGTTHDDRHMTITGMVFKLLTIILRITSQGCLNNTGQYWKSCMADNAAPLNSIFLSQMHVQQQSFNICNTAIIGNHHDTSDKIKIYKDQIYKSSVNWLVRITDYLNITFG